MQEYLALAEDAYRKEDADGIANAPPRRDRQTNVTPVPISSPYSDSGNAQRFVANNPDVRFAPLWRKWLVWDGRRWQPDAADCRVMNLAKRTFLSLFGACQKEIGGLASLAASGDEDAKRIHKAVKVELDWALKSQDARRIRAAIELARGDVRIDHAELDANQWLLNVRNGTIDLKTGKLRRHDPRDLITKLVDVHFDPAAKCPIWDAVLNRVMDRHDRMIDYLRRAVGYSLTGSTAEQCLFFLHGTGKNGKSKFLEAIQHVLGEYGGTAAPDLLLQRNGNSHPTELADLHGKRFISTIEVEDGRRFAESLVKQLTGGDGLKARRMREDFWEFAPTFKIWLAANAKPEVRGTDFAIWRRIKLIPFGVTISDEEDDKNLSEKLKAEAPGILAWAVRGCLEWQHGGLAEPEEVKLATQEYQAEQDLVGRFVRECCLVGANYNCRAADIFQAFQSWVASQGEKDVMKQRRFAGELRKHCTLDSYKSNGVVYTGIAVSVQAEIPD